jgi:hypothetical protein
VRIAGKQNMSKPIRWVFVLAAPLAAATALAAARISPSPSPPKLHAALQIKPGLWEFNDRAKVAGDTVFRDALVAGIPAAQRAQHLAELRQMISQPSRERECINQTTFEQRLFGIEASCKRTIASNTAGRFELVTECRGESGGVKQYKTARILATSPTSVTTSFHAVSTQASKTMTVDSVENGHWVGSNCGNVHGIEQL